MMLVVLAPEPEGPTLASREILAPEPEGPTLASREILAPELEGPTLASLTQGSFSINRSFSGDSAKLLIASLRVR